MEENALERNNVVVGKSFSVFAIAALFVMFDSFHLQFVRNIPALVIPLLGALIMGGYMLMHPLQFVKDESKRNLVIVFAIICVYQFLFCTERNATTIMLYIFTFLTGMTVIRLNDEYKIKLLEYISVSLGLILLFSIPGWIMYLLHIPMPHHTEYDGVFYTHTFYPTFTLNGYPYQNPISRFTSVFQEPGHLATTCVFLLFLNRFNLRKWYNVLFLVSDLMSLSLAGYGLLLLALGFYILIFSKYKKTAIVILVMLMALVTFLSLKINSGDNVIYEKIVSRLEYSEDKGIAGNNRYSSNFESKYKKFVKSSDVYFGVGNLPRNKKWWHNSAGWKRAVVTNGVIGLILVCLFYYMNVRKYRHPACVAFFILWLVSNSIRDHVLKEYWLYLFICAMPLLSSYVPVRKRKKAIDVSTEK